MGRFVIWTESAFSKLNHIFGTTTKLSQVKKGFKIPTAQMAVPDMKRVVKAAEKAKILREKKEVRKAPKRLNPLRNWAAMIRLNPYAAIAKNRMHQIQIAKAKAKAVYAEKINKILEAKKEAMKQANEARKGKPKRENGKLVRVKVDGKLVKPVVKRSAKKEAYLKKMNTIKKAQVKAFNKKIAL
jgi:large subunit ribosomal protein L4e